MAKNLDQNSWDLKQHLLSQIQANGGWVNTHAHLDRAYSISLDNLELGNAQLQEKWYLVDELKRNSTVSDIYDRLSFALEKQREQGVTTLLSFIDVDEVVKDKALKAAEKLRQQNTDMTILFANQCLKGVINQEAHKWFELGAEFADVIGGLPGKDAGHEAEHLDIILQKGQELGKMVHVHVDQLNKAKERETELLINKTKEHNMQGRVVAIHSVSLACQPKEYRDKIYQQLAENQVSVTTCPSAWIDARRCEELVPNHNAITPIEELVASEVVVSLGTDNIADIYKPFSDGDMWTELRFLLESCHFYDLEELVRIATENGRQCLGIN